VAQNTSCSTTRNAATKEQTDSKGLSAIVGAKQLCCSDLLDFGPDAGVDGVVEADVSEENESLPGAPLEERFQVRSYGRRSIKTVIQ